MVIWDYPDKYEPNYLIRKKRNGFYYFQQKAQSISSIDNTLRFVSLNGNEVYDTEKDSLFTIPCDGSSYLLYLGQLDGQPVFTNQDTIYFQMADASPCRMMSIVKRLPSMGMSVL